MKIAISATDIYMPSSKKKTGIGRYNSVVLESLLEHGQNHAFDVRVKFDFNRSLFPNHSRAKFHASWSKIIGSKRGRELDSFLTSSDIFFNLSNVPPIHKQERNVGIIHDLIPFTHPELEIDPNGNPLPTALNTKQTLLKKVAERSSLILCNSKHTQDNLCKVLNCPKEKTFVAYYGANSLITRKQIDADNQKTIDSYGLEKDKYILSVSRLAPRKNYPRLIEAFARLKDTPRLQDIKLAIAGPDYLGQQEIENSIHKYSLKGRALLLGVVFDEDLDVLYRNALCYICPSIEEGFGLPVLEAMSYGLPVVTSNGGALPEVGGDVCAYFDPLNIDEMATAIKVGIEQGGDKNHWSPIFKSQADKFSTERFADDIFLAFEKHLSRG